MDQQILIEHLVCAVHYSGRKNKGYNTSFDAYMTIAKGLGPVVMCSRRKQAMGKA